MSNTLLYLSNGPTRVSVARLDGRFAELGFDVDIRWAYEGEVAAQVTDLTFLGSGLRAGLRCGGDTLVAPLPFDTQSAALRAGQTVRFRYDPQDLMPYGGADR